MTLTHWLDGAKAFLPDAVRIRRDIHQHPELGLHLPRTTAAAKAEIADLGLEIAEGPSTSGFVATLRGPANGRTVLLRGDMDALPMPEDTDLPFKSEVPNTMHACGHDSHTAMLACAVRLLHANRERLAGTVKFMFQPGEEGYFGARHMLADGLIDRDGVPDGALAIHITPNLPTGVLASKAGPFMASADVLEIVVRGRGGHASSPHDALDPMPVAAEIVLALQSFVTRRVSAFDPVVLTIAKIEGGTTNNVIPETVTLTGTLRSVSETSRRKAKEGVIRLAGGIASAHGAAAEVEWRQGYDVTVNDGRMVALAAEAARDMLGPRGFFPMPSPVMGAEDWSYVLQKIPGAMVFLGVAPEGCDHASAAPCHSNRMLLDEPAMAHGIALYAAVAERFLERGFPASG
jgi:amidohydrolase